MRFFTKKFKNVLDIFRNALLRHLKMVSIFVDEFSSTASIEWLFGSLHYTKKSNVLITQKLVKLESP